VLQRALKPRAETALAGIRTLSGQSSTGFGTGFVPISPPLRPNDTSLPPPRYLSAGDVPVRASVSRARRTMTEHV